MSFLIRRILIAAAPVVWRKIQQRRRDRLAEEHERPDPLLLDLLVPRAKKL